MIEYKYSLIEDLKTAANVVWLYFWLKKNKMIFFLPTLGRFIRIRRYRPKPLQIDIAENITCYFTSSGTWGAYELPNKIFICPWENRDMASVIKHEITHLRHEREVRNLKHKEKEKIIESKDSKEW